MFLEDRTLLRDATSSHETIMLVNTVFPNHKTSIIRNRLAKKDQVFFYLFQISLFHLITASVPKKTL